MLIPVYKAIAHYAKDFNTHTYTVVCFNFEANVFDDCC